MENSLSHKSPSKIQGCPEEPNVLGPEDGYGYCPVRIGLKVTKDLEIIRKLGWGGYSTVWLAHDTRDGENTYCAIKMLTSFATTCTDEGALAEPKILRHIDQYDDLAGYDHLVQSFGSFRVALPHGEHIGLIYEVVGPDLNTVTSAFPGRRFPPAMVKQIIRQTLEALDFLHRSCQIIHTDLKPANMMLCIDAIDSVVREAQQVEPPTLYPNGPSTEDSMTCADTIRSQPLPFHYLDPDGRNIKVKLGDFGHATRVDKHLREDIQPEALRAPEVILGHPWSTAVDIWSLGCLVFEYLAGTPLFRLKSTDKYHELDYHLATMTQFTGQKFPEDMLAASKHRDVFFRPNGEPRRARADRIEEISDTIKHYDPTIPEAEILGATALIKRCLQLRPGDRPSAAELLDDPWLKV